jgi:RNA polymerase sigma-70 factor (ECF subfamily)
MDAVVRLDHGFATRRIGQTFERPAHAERTMTDDREDRASEAVRRDGAVRAEIEILFTRHHAEIYAYLARMVREPEMAADLAQDTFVKAYRAYDTLEDPARARAWLYQIAHRVALDEFRRRRIVRFIPWTGESRGAAPSAEHIALEGRFSGEMERALLRMPERQRSALILAELHDLTGLELAAALGVSHVAARAILTRARESLRQALSDERARSAASESATGTGRSTP